MRKQIAIGSAFAVALGLAGCAAPAENEGEAATDEAVEATEADADATLDGAMTGEADAAEGEGDASTGLDQDGNPIHN